MPAGRHGVSFRIIVVVVRFLPSLPLAVAALAFFELLNQDSRIHVFLSNLLR